MRQDELASGRVFRFSAVAHALIFAHSELYSQGSCNDAHDLYVLNLEI